MLRSTKSTLYERLGGEQNISSIITEFYHRMLQDDRINHHFIGINLESLRRHLITYMMRYALGGPNRYEGNKLRNSHAGLQITSDEYEIAIKHFNGSLRKYDVLLDDVAKIEAFLRSVKPHIIDK